MAKIILSDALRENPTPRTLRNGSGIPYWPERTIGRDPAINLAEVEAALRRRRRRAPVPSLRNGRPPNRSKKELVH